MKIENMIWEMANDFAAVMECEHCGWTKENRSGYHDNYYHTKVIPAMTCEACGKDRAGNIREETNVH